MCRAGQAQSWARAWQWTAQIIAYLVPNINSDRSRKAGLRAARAFALPAAMCYTEAP
jgi:hypothetical protein